jgi:hypothetical protein
LIAFPPNCDSATRNVLRADASFPRVFIIEQEPDEDNRMTLRIATAASFFLAWVGSTSVSLAGPTLFETANGSTTTNFTGFDDNVFFMHRFQVAAPVQLESVGGTFGNFSDFPITPFAAIVALTGSSDVPNSNDLTTSDVLGTTLLSSIPADEFDGIERTGQISLNIAAGWYALVFGSGKFGASSAANFDLAMPDFTNDLAPGQLPTSLFLPTHAQFPNLIINQVSDPRFFATIVPEPSTWMLGAIGSAFVALLAGRTSRRRRPS